VVKPKKYESNYTCLANRTLRGVRLSDGAFRLLVFLLTQGKDYNPSEAALAKRFGITPRTISKRVAELREAGHLRIEIFRHRDGKSELKWVVSEFPMELKNNPP